MELLNEVIFGAKDTLEELEVEEWPAQVDSDFDKMLDRFDKALDNIEEQRDRWIALGSLYPNRYDELQETITDMLERQTFESGPFEAIELPAEVGGTTLNLEPDVLTTLGSLGLITGQAE